MLAVDENGHALNHACQRRFFTGPQRDATMIAFPTCDDPTGSIRSIHCQIDHLLEWTDGGPTDTANGRPLCKGHNLWKEHQRAKRGVTGRYRRRRTEP